ncbi:MAG: penicillin-binding protein 1C [Alphaproteobacteria bacterium]|nr:penicillin-binding protein 1C [Alphaproteobacteria bacterium]
MRRRLPRLLATVVALVLLAGLAVVGSAWMAPLPERLRAPGSTVVTYEDGATAHVFLAPDDRWRVPVALDEVDPAYVDALLRYEDKRFYAHPGVDPVAVMRAVVVNARHGRVMTGASTLTMQLVRMVEPRPRSLRSKIVEAHRALTIELHLSKAEILEAYLTFAPYGRNVEGVEAASLAYFGHSANALAPDEIATLLAVPQNPNVRYPSPGNAERLRAARDDIAGFLLDTGGLLPGELGTKNGTLEEVAESPVPASLRAFPREAPHLATALAGRHPAGSRIPTTLSRGTQRMVEELVRLERDALVRKGVHNGAVIVVHSETREVRALVGNLDFWEGEAGQILAATEPRSPGSALKPFIYALAIDRGTANPAHLVRDIPRSWGSYTPQNYDERFRGLVRLETALSESLNLPFVGLLHEVGVETFLNRLRTMGVESLDARPGHYGLSLAAGGVELTPLEVAGLYATLANGGAYGPVHVQRTEQPPPVRVFSDEAAWLTARTLRIKDRPDFPSRRMFSGTPSGIAWKTGTSFGHRDAWAAGFGPEHTAVVWLGNLDYRPARDLVGSEAAGPILFDVLEAVEGRKAVDFPRPEGLARVEVCRYSGYLATDACPHRAHTDAPVTAVPTEPCPFHQTLAIDLQTGEALAPGCRDGRDWEERQYLVWPATVRRFLADQHGDLPSPPAYAKGCTPSGDREPPVILTPQSGQVSILIPGIDPLDQEIPLSAEVDRPDARLSWFVDGEFLATVDVEERVWWAPTPGEHLAVVVDEAGQRAFRRFAVREP